MTEATVKVFVVTPEPPTTFHTTRGAVATHQFTDDQLAAIGADWTTRLIENARKRRAENEKK